MDASGFRQEQRGVASAMIGALVVTFGVLGGVAMLDRTEPAVSFAARLQTAIRVDLIVIASLVAAIANVARLRFFSAQDIDGSSADTTSPKCAGRGQSFRTLWSRRSWRSPRT